MKPYFQDDAVTIYLGDSREIVPTLGRFDLLLTDPPYGIDAAADTTGRPANLPLWFPSPKLRRWSESARL